MARIERRTRLNAPVSEVFAYIADFQTIKDYNPSIIQVRILSDIPPVKGCRYEITLSMFGRKIRPVLTITDMIKNELIVTRLEAFIPAIENRRFQAAGDETDFLFTIEFSSGWPLIGPLVDTILIRLFAGRQADTEIRLLEKRFNITAEQ